MRTSKHSRRIVVNDVEYRWRARADDYGSITLAIWPSNNIGPLLHGAFDSDVTWVRTGPTCHQSTEDQVVITNRIVRRVLERAIAVHAYDPLRSGADLGLGSLDGVIKLDDAERAPGRSIDHYPTGEDG